MSLPSPTNIELERELLNTILDSIEECNQPLNEQQLNAVGNVTPWMSWQLGCVAEALSTQGRNSYALNVAICSIVKPLRHFFSVPPAFSAVPHRAFSHCEPHVVD